MGKRREIKLLIGGSPCTYWSIAQTKNRETEASGLGWELFKNYVIARDKYHPDYFLYENNKSMSQAIREKITEELGVEPVLINSALVSAQNRQRLYWVGKRNPDGTYSRIEINQPEDRGLMLRDILEGAETWTEKAYALTTKCCNAIPEDTIKRHRHTMAAVPVNITADGKAQCLRATYYKDGVRNLVGNTVDRKTCVAEPIEYTPLHSCDVVVTDQNIRCSYKDGSGTAQGYTVTFDDVKAPSVIAGHAHKMKVIERATGKETPIYEVCGGYITIKGKQYPIKLEDGFYIIRKLTPTECKRLQTVPDNYVFPVSDTQTYKMLGNGWTVDVIAHIMSHFDGLLEKPVEVLSMYDGMSCGHIALDKLGATVTRYYATEIDEYAIQTTLCNYPNTVQLGDAFQIRDDKWSLPSDPEREVTDKSLTLAALLDVLKPDEEILVVHRIGPHECEAVAGGTAAELQATRCVEVCGDNIVERVAVNVDDWPEVPTPILFITIGGKEAGV